MRTGRSQNTSALVGWAVAGSERGAACPSSFGADPVRVLDVYLVSAAPKSLLPFAIVGGISWWWRRAAVRVAP